MLRRRDATADHDAGQIPNRQFPGRHDQLFVSWHQEYGVERAFLDVLHQRKHAGQHERSDDGVESRVGAEDDQELGFLPAVDRVDLAEDKSDCDEADREIDEDLPDVEEQVRPIVQLMQGADSPQRNPGPQAVSKRPRQRHQIPTASKRRIANRHNHRNSTANTTIHATCRANPAISEPVDIDVVSTSIGNPNV